MGKARGLGPPEFLERMRMALLRSTRCSSLSFEGRPRRADFFPRLRDALARGCWMRWQMWDVALLRSVSVNLAELRRVAP